MPFCSVHSPFKSYKKRNICALKLQMVFDSLFRRRMGRNHDRGETKLPSKMVLINFAKDFLIQVLH